MKKQQILSIFSLLSSVICVNAYGYQISEDYNALLSKEQALVKNIKLTTSLVSNIHYGDENEFISGDFFHYRFNDHHFRIFPRDPSKYSAKGYVRRLSIRFQEPILDDNYQSTTMEFVAPFNNRLQAIMYNNATRATTSNSATPGLAVGYSTITMGPACNTVSGRFKVLEVEVALSGQIIRFAADYEQHCDGAEAGLYGAVRYNSNYPVISNPGAFVDGKLVLPLVEVRNRRNEREYYSLVLHADTPDSKQYQVDAMIPAKKLDPMNIFIPASYDDKQKLYIVPSVLNVGVNGEVEEYEMRFTAEPVELKVGDYLTLDEKRKLR